MCKIRRLTMLLAILLAFTFIQSALADPEDYDETSPESLTEDELYGEAAIAIDNETGDILFSKDANERMYPASTTKIMTLLLAVESGWSFDMEVTIPSEASDIPSDSSLVPVYPGEKMTFGDLLYGMMLHSGNDAANAVAVLVSGSVSAFVEKMNERAAELGCTGTNFVNPHGYHDENHYTTARDLALIAREALSYESIREIVSTAEYTITVDTRGEISLRNTNSMLISNSGYYYEECIGIKTGTTSKAGYCFVGAVEKEGAIIITVTLKCDSDEERWTDTERLFEYGFTCYTAYTLEDMFDLTSSSIATIRVSNASEDDELGGVLQLELVQVSDNDYVRLVATGNEEAQEAALADFTQRAQITLVDNLTAPITEGELVGEFSYTTQDGEVITASLIASRSIEAQPEETTIYDVFPFLEIFTNPLVQMLIVVLILLIVVLILYYRYKRHLRERRRREIYERRKREYMQKQHSNSTRRGGETSRRGQTSRTGQTSGQGQRSGRSSPTSRQSGRTNSRSARGSTPQRKSNSSQTQRSKRNYDDDDLFGGF